MSVERFNYAKSLGYDVLALTELWRNQRKFQTGRKQFIVSKPKLVKTGPNKGKKRFPNDRAAGVGILLSKRMERKVHSFGTEGERIWWVRIKGPVCNLFIIAVYLPHRGRVEPAQEHTLNDLQKLLSNVPTRDCICMLGDFNEQLAANVDGVTGEWTGGPPSRNADKITELLRIYNLTAINTTYRPKKGKSVHTFLKTKRSENINSDLSQLYVGRTATCKYKKRWITGKVIAPSVITSEPAWIVRYSDGYHKTYNEESLKKVLVHEKPDKVGHQIDYIFVSRRWKSSVTSCSVSWAPSIHRNLHGEKDDHALLHTKWKWRIHSPKTRIVKDFTALTKVWRDEQGNLIANPTLNAFSAVVESKMTELGSQDMDAIALHKCMSAAIKYAIDTTLPNTERNGGTKRCVSATTKGLFEKRTRMKNRNQAQYSELQKKIRESSLRDFQNWVEEHSKKMNKANGHGDTRAIYKSVKELSASRRKPPKNLTTDGHGKILQNAKEVATRWYTFLSNKFAATVAETQRPEMEPLTQTAGTDQLTETEILKGLSKMKQNKATGPDGIPITVFQQCPICKKLLIKLLQQIWDEETVPTDFGEAKFVMLFKSKGSADDPTKYRCLGLLNHCYKVLSQCMLARLQKETSDFLPDWQAGFQQKRGCRDNVLILRTLFDAVLQRHGKMCVSFIDYSAAFDSVSHKFIDVALAEAGATDKTRSIFRAIYQSATARTEVEGIDGKAELSNAFPVNRGVVQGDITSPWYFIIALELILRRHDTHPGKGVPFGDRTIYTLGYADDAALVDTNIDVATARVTSIATGSRKDADMSINIDKTEVMHVATQERATHTTNAEAAKVCKFKCKNVGCRMVFQNAHGAKCHAGKCKWRHAFAMNRILEVKGEPGTSKCKYLTRWKDYGPADDTWL